MQEIKSRYRVEGMDCASCALKVDTAARRLPGVTDVAVSVTAGTMTVTHDGTSDLARLEKTVTGLGYRVFPAERASPPAATAAAPAACCAGHDDGHAHDHHGHDDVHGDERGHDHPSATHAHGGGGHDHGPMTGPWWQSPKARLAGLSGLALLAAYGFGHLFPAVATPVFIAALLVGLVPIALRAYAAARAGTPFSIETLMVIAAAGAVIIHATEEAAMVVFLFLVGELLEGIAATRARASIGALSALVPKTAFRLDGETLTEVPAESLRPGAVIRVRPGDRIPADGEILAGESGIDQSPVTGESVAVRKGKGDPVFAGTINGDAVLTVRVTAAAADNTIARVIRLVEEAQEAKAPMERFIDRFSRIYTPSVLAAGALVAILPPLLFGQDWSEWVYKGLAILLIGCPCALVISTPAAIAAALSSGARAGLLVKGGAVLEKLGEIDTVAFDKTGTLTAGMPAVTDVIAFSGTADEVLALAAALEKGSSHPLAKAVLQKAAGLVIPDAADNRALGGKGVEGRVGGREVFFGSMKAAEERLAIGMAERSRVAALNGEGKTVSLVIVDGVLAGAIALRDEPRPDAVAAIRELTAAGIRTLMLTGDNHLTAQAVGATLGMDVCAELMPADKQKIVQALKAEGRTVAKIGDGINDAPALAAADVGIAMGGGTDVALETADAAILNGRVGDVARLIRLSRSAMGNIRQNITIALGLKLVFLVTTLIGVTGLWPAILADTGATVLVTINALRLLKLRR